MEGESGRVQLEKRGMRVLSWNLNCHLAVGAKDMSGRMQQFVAVVERAHRPDIVCVQEVFVGKIFGVSFEGVRQQLIKDLEAMEYVAVCPRASVPLLVGQNCGLLTFVRRRAVLGSDEVKFEASAEWASNKGFQIVQLEGGVTVFNCHLDSRGPCKAEQLAQLMSAVKRAAQEKKAIVAAGDFNICIQHVWDKGEGYANLARSMSECGLVDFFGEFSDMSFALDRACYDHIFSNCRLQEKQIRSNRTSHRLPELSDHCGLEAVVSNRFKFLLFDDALHREAVIEIFTENLKEEWSVHGPAVVAKVALPYIATSCAGDLATINSTYFRFLVCVDRDNNDQVVGMVGLERIEEKKGELRRMHLRKAFRGSGLGTGLVALLLFSAAYNGFESVILGTPQHNVRSVRFYEKCGFSLSRRRELVPNSDTVMMLYMHIKLK